LIALSGVPAGYVFYHAALAPNNWIYEGANSGNWKDGGVHGASVSITGAGIPVIAIGYRAFFAFFGGVAS
jgi:hypothetical protein